MNQGSEQTARKLGWDSGRRGRRSRKFEPCRPGAGAASVSVTILAVSVPLAILTAHACKNYALLALLLLVAPVPLSEFRMLVSVAFWLFNCPIAASAAENSAVSDAVRALSIACCREML